MDSLVLHRTDSNSSSLKSGSEKENEENIPTWKVPLTSSLIGKSRHQDDDKSKRDSTIPKKAQISPELAEDEATAQLIQILLPCIICNRTFSPEALERHAKICASVNIKDPKRQNRGTFDSSEQRKKDTKIADFIPPPVMDSNGEFVRTGSRRFRDSFSRGSKNRSSLGKTSTTTITTAVTTTTTTTNNSPNITTSSSIPTWKRGHTSPVKAAPPTTLEISKHIEPYESNSEFGSEESQDTDSKCGRTVPSYARALSPSEDCPYCGRNFVIKAYDRHVKFCQDVYIRKQYEHQPVPKEKEEAMERQELRTKYKPLKGSTSCGSLRSMSPPKDFPSMMAMKFYGFMNKTFNRNNFKKSNESLTNSCYGDFTRSMRKSSPAPSVASTITNNHKPLMYQRSNTTMHSIKGSPVMRVNTSSNIPKRTKSIENLNLANVTSSGYGQQHTSNNSSNSFTRNSKTRSSLHKNFFRNSSKRVEPEGTENTSSSGSPGALIITPMSFYSKGKNYSSMMESQEDARQKQLQNNIPNNNLLQHNTMLMNRNNSQSHHGNHEDMRKKSPLLNSDPTYDPYEKAARQFEELLKSQPARNNENKQSNRSQARKVGLDRAFRSVADPFMPEFNDEERKVAPSMTQSLMTQSMNNNHSGFGSGFSKPQNNVKTEVNSFVFNSSDDSYWDQILKKNNVKSSTSSQETQDDSQTTTDSDNGKSRAVSNISSVDSAFSRTDGADLEFEALETLVSLGDVPPSSVSSQGGGGGGPVVLPAVIDSNKPSYPSRRGSSSTILSPLSSTNCQHNDGNPGMSKAMSPDSPRLPQLPNTQQQENNSLFSSLYASRDKAGDANKTNGLSKSGGSENSANNHGSVTVAKFCHECGTQYPTSTAKFCPECGERRVMK
ncbi:unnamed protein product [Allacma fusca]|uniref:C2HC/C3H-type domain-containing protein n=1 Tax=Allacma fusca TaxID=39272 RepID=A0A8J2K829_9HEXA|nr:unnamed protein product [Allacma fusca]